MGKQQSAAPPAPVAPDPTATAAAQTKSNIDTATAQTNLNLIDQSTPNGALKYTQIGTNANGTPKYQATTTLSAAQQGLLDTNNVTQQKLATTAQNQAGRLDAILAQPLDISNDATEARLMELGRKRLDPLLADRRQATESDLLNRGIRPGSTNYAQAQDIANQGENDAFNQLLLNGHSQAVSEALAARNQPLNELIGLSSGTQISSPSFVSTPQTGVAGTNVSGIAQDAYNNANQAYQYGQNQQQQQQQDLYGGLFGLGKAAIGLFSDKRLKTDIRSTGRKIAGVPEKSWTWRGTDKRDTGVIAQDLEKKFPHLVNMDPSGFRRVNYAGLMAVGTQGMAA